MDYIYGLINIMNEANIDDDFFDEPLELIAINYAIISMLIYWSI